MAHIRSTSIQQQVILRLTILYQKLSLQKSFWLKLPYLIASILIIYLVLIILKPSNLTDELQEELSFVNNLLGKSYLEFWYHENSKLVEAYPFGGIAQKSSLDSSSDLFNKQIKILNVCHPNWHGIRQATLGQGYPVLEINEFQPGLHQNLLLKYIERMKYLEVFMVNGIPFNAVNFTQVLRDRFPHIKIIFIYHGSISQPFHLEESDALHQVISAAQNKTIDKLGVVKNGMINVFKAMGIDAFEVWNFPDSPVGARRLGSIENVNFILQSQSKFETDYSRIKSVINIKGNISYLDVQNGQSRWNIGIFGSHWNHKNVNLQIISMCQLSNVKIHVLKKPKISYLSNCLAEIIEHGEFIPHDQFINIIQSMDINLYISMTECFPMTVIESITFGIPAITSATSLVYSQDQYLTQYLVVNYLDSPDSIAQAVLNVMENYSSLTRRLWMLLPYIYLKTRSQFDTLLFQDSNRYDVEIIDYNKFSYSDLLPIEDQKAIVCFVTDGVFPDVFSSQSIATYSLVNQLLQNGHQVIILFYNNEWKENRFKNVLPNPQNLKIFYAEDFAQSDLNVLKNNTDLLIANAINSLYQTTKFDIIEFPDTYGLPYDILKSYANPEIIMQQKIKDNNVQYLYPPSTVDSFVVYLRVYGTMQMRLLESYSKFNKDEKKKFDRLFLKEQFCLITSDKVLISDVYQYFYLKDAYGLNLDQVSYSPIDLQFLSNLINTIPKKDIKQRLTSPQQTSITFAIWDPFSSPKEINDMIVWCAYLMQNLSMKKTVAKGLTTFDSPDNIKFIIIKTQLQYNGFYEEDLQEPEILPEFLENFTFEMTDDFAQAVSILKNADAMILTHRVTLFDLISKVSKFLNLITVGPAHNINSYFQDIDYPFQFLIEESFKNTMKDCIQSFENGKHTAVISRRQQMKKTYESSSEIQKLVQSSKLLFTKYELTRQTVRRRHGNLRAEWIRYHYEQD